MNTRRSFFQDAALLSALASLAGEEAFAQVQAQQHDPKVSNFWDAYFDEAERDPTHVSRGSNDAALIDPSKRVQLIHATDSGLIYPDGIDAKQLLPDPDVVVTLNPSHFRPAPDDTKAIAKSKGCQIRLDCVQTRPIMNLIAPMAWAGLAAWSLDKTTYSASKVSDLNANPVMDPKTGKQKIVIKASAGPAAPQLKDLDFTDPNAPGTPAHNQVILPGGAGRLALNVRAVSTNNRLQSVLDKTVSYSSIVAPFFGFAPLAIPALRAFTTLLGAVFNHEAVVMNSMPLQVLATQDAWKNPRDSSSLKIVSGDYIAIPINQAGNLKDSMDKLRIVNGWLVHQDSAATLPPEQRAQDPKIPEVTYLSLSMTVQSLATAQQNKAKGG
jgi:hypothetical protein